MNWNPFSWFSKPSQPQPEQHFVRASSFADPADIAAFRAAKAKGWTDHEAFKVGDNGIGLWGDSCIEDRPMCALPYEDWLEKWGSSDAARLRRVTVTANGRTIICALGDTMPHRANIKNGRGIDLNPAACKLLGLEPPVDCKAIWSWV